MKLQTPTAGIGQRRMRQILRIVHIIAAELDVPAEAFTEPTRGVALVAQARQLAMAAVRTRLCLPFAVIGSLFGNRDHGTVIHACKAVSRRIRVDADLRRLWLSVTAKNP